jgi:hypothetical protein
MPIEFDINEVKKDCNIYFETGLWNVKKEETSLCKAIKMNFDKCCSVEINSDLIDIAELKFDKEIKENKLKLFEGNSKLLKSYLSELDLQEKDRILFFLDSHGHGHGCPLVEELEAIKNLKNNNHTILIDDIRIIRSCVWSDERYTGDNFEDLLKKKLLDINENYKFTYLDGHVPNDVLCCQV